MTDKASGAGTDSLLAYSFYLEIDGLAEAMFREVGGLSSETSVIEQIQASKDGKQIIIKHPGQLKWGDITLKRGATSDKKLYDWRQMVVDGKMKDARKNGSIVLYDTENKEVARWNFVNAWPSKLSLNGFNASGNDTAVEELTLVHEGLTRMK